MIKCKYCGTHNVYRQGWPYCLSCGASVPQIERVNNTIQCNISQPGVTHFYHLVNEFMVVKALSASDFGRAY